MDMAKEHPFTDNIGEERYELDLGTDTALIEYVREPGVVILTHTFVPKRYEGKGIGSEIVRAALEDIRNRQERVVPQCGFVAAYIYRHPEWEQIVYNPRREPSE